MKNPLEDPEVSGRVVQQFLELFFHPEIQRRQERGEVDVPFELVAAQAVFPPSGQAKVRLNSEVLFALDATLADGSRTEDKRYSIADITHVREFRLTPVDKDCGHATLFRIGDSWQLHFDFRRNQDTCRLWRGVALEFLEAATVARQSGGWRVFVDTLFSACELGAKASLLWFADDKFRQKQSHKAISSRFNMYARSGNIPEDVREVFNTLARSRWAARYVTGESSVDPAEADRWLSIVTRFLSSP